MICPDCGEWIDEGDPICPSCGAYIGDNGDDYEEYECPVCHEQFIIDDDNVCRYCGAPIKKKDEFFF